MVEYPVQAEDPGDTDVGTVGVLRFVGGDPIPAERDTLIALWSLPYSTLLYPDGQVRIDLDDAEQLEQYPVCTIMRTLSNWDAVQEVLVAAAVLRTHGAKRIELFAPYIFGSRSDRAFAPGDCNYMQDVIGPLLRNAGIERCLVMDPHSPAMLQSLPGGTAATMVPFYRWVNKQFIADVVIAPDAGALARAQQYATMYNLPICCATKQRDPDTGKITRYNLDPAVDLAGKNVLVVDDLCDGGATFLMLGEALQMRLVGDTALCVTHGLFSKGFAALEQFYDRIYFTDSTDVIVSEDPEGRVLQYPIMSSKPMKENNEPQSTTQN